MDARAPRLAIALAVLGAAVATYLTLVETHVVDHGWDPLFGDGTDEVLHSSVSRALPFPDAALGLLAYAAEAVLGLTAAGDRWQRRPVLPLAFDLVGLGLAVAAVALVALQATVVHSWCTLCLCSAALSFAILAAGRLHEARGGLALVRTRRAAAGRGPERSSGGDPHRSMWMSSQWWPSGSRNDHPYIGPSAIRA
ncbi:peptidoglycan/LPS O-acetylase OafA/YrhL [Marmoricola sp. URHA0025 HA25]